MARSPRILASESVSTVKILIVSPIQTSGIGSQRKAFTIKPNAKEFFILQNAAFD